MGSLHGSPARGYDVPRGRFVETGRFSRMFPHLRSLRSFSPGPEVLGAVGGRMDGGSPPPTDTSQDNPRTKAGYTFLGQLVDHDLTFDPTSVLEQQVDPQATRNFRTPALELDSVYGLGPAAQPYLYDQERPGRMLLGPDGHDLPRNSQGRALTGDPRDDENVLVSQLHLVFLHFHNRVFDTHTDPAASTGERFQDAQRTVRWHYQWVVLHELLARLVGPEVVARTLAEVPFRFPGGRASMPLEFSVAAYRFGHSQVRPGYLLSAPGTTPVRAAALFPGAPGAERSVGDLRGGRPVPPELRVDMAAFFGPAAQPSKLVDPRISTTLLRLPFSVVGPQRDPSAPPESRPMVHSLATRNLQRGIDACLPSGQAVARALRVPVLDEDVLWDGVEGGRGPAPLWFYVLREAEVLTGGRMLAGVGAQVVARTLVAVLEADAASVVVQDPGWRPWLGAVPGRFTMSDLVGVALGTELGHEDVDALPGATTGTSVPAARTPVDGTPVGPSPRSRSAAVPPGSGGC